MGNTLDKGNPRDDNIWLGLSHKSIFNDSFVSEQYNKLPAFEGTEVLSSINELYLHNQFLLPCSTLNRKKKKSLRKRSGFFFL